MKNTWRLGEEISAAEPANDSACISPKKAELFGDLETRNKVQQAKDPGAAKALGRTVRGFDEAVWQEHRWAIVVEANRHNFTQHPALHAFLAGTSNRVLVEASPIDRIWGNGLDAASPLAEQPGRWPGLNLLGFALMEVREAIGDVDG